VHYRSDLPSSDDKHWRCRIDLQRQETGPKKTLQACAD
jgi:succinate dehydrogenase/fumarate reductase flavoprotein subunit